MPPNRRIELAIAPNRASLAQTEKEFLASIARMKRAASQVGGFSTFGGRATTTTTRGGGDAELRKAQAEIKRLQQERGRAERELTRLIEREARQQAQVRTREMKRAANEMIREIERVRREEAKAARAQRPTGFGGVSSAFGAGLIGGFVGGAAVGAISAVTSALTQGGKALLDYSSRMEQTKIGFTTLVGSSQLAEKHLRELQKFAAETPFEFESLAQMSRRLQGVGVDASKVIPLMRDIGNVASATGDVSAERLEGITTAITQIISKTKVSAEEMEQLAERGVPAWQLLAEATGKSQAELRELSKEGAISSDVLVQALQKISREKFGDAMSQQSKTFAGALSTIKDTVVLAAADLFKPVYDEISKFTVRFSQSLQNQETQALNVAERFGFAIGEAIGGGIQKGAASKGTGKAGGFTGGGGQGLLGGGFGLLETILGAGIAGFIKGREADPGKGVVDALKKVTDQVNKLTGGLESSVVKLPSLADKLAAEKAKKQTESLVNTVRDLSLQVQFFGDESQVAATKQQLLSQGITDFSSGLAQQAVLWAQRLDDLKRNQEAQEKYNNELKNAREELDKIRQDADFELRFTDPTDLDRFNEQVRRGAFNFGELKEEIEKTREALKKLALQRGLDERNKKLTDFAENLKRAIEDLEDTDLSEFERQIVKLVEPLNLEKAFRGSIKTEDFAREVEDQILVFQRALDQIKRSAAGIQGDPAFIEAEINKRLEAATTAFYNNFQIWLSQFKTLAGDALVNIFAEDFDFERGFDFVNLFNAVFDKEQTDKLKTFNDLAAELDAEIQQLNVDLGVSAEISRADALSKDLQTKAIKGLTQAEKDQLLAKAQEIDQLRASVKIQEQIREQYEETRETLIDIFDILTESGESFSKRIGNVFKYISDRFREMLVRMAADWLTSKLFGGGGTSGGFGNIFQGLFGGGGFGGGPGGTPVFNPNFAASGGGGGFGGFGNIFGNIFGGGRAAAGPSHELGHLAGGGRGFGTLSGIGAIASIAGGAIGGRFGNILSLAGTGLSLGMMFGGPIGGAIGAAIGAGVGLIASLFGGDPKRKRDKNEKLPELQKGFTDALQQLRQLHTDVRSLRVDPDSAISKADELRAAIATGFGIQFESKKYRKQAQQQIQTRLREADAIIADIRAAAEISRAASERQRRILPEFADGGSVSSFFRQNFSGLIPGIYDRRDNKLIRVSGNEVVLTPSQWQPIAPYLKAKKVPGFADGGMVSGFAPIKDERPIIVNIRIEGQIDAARIKELSIEGLDTYAAQRKIQTNIQYLRRNNEDV